jgi:hypothetical protein
MYIQKIIKTVEKKDLHIRCGFMRICMRARACNCICMYVCMYVRMYIRFTRTYVYTYNQCFTIKIYNISKEKRQYGAPIRFTCKIYF